MRDKGKAWLLIPFAVLSGILGRMGGAEDYDKLYRRIGCSVLVIVGIWCLFGLEGQFWWAYALIFGLHVITLGTYWDRIFGYDNFAFSGFMVGLAAAPLLCIDLGLWPILLARACALAFIWWALNKFLPPGGIWKWHRDVVDEYLRYFVTL